MVRVDSGAFTYVNPLWGGTRTSPTQSDGPQRQTLATQLQRVDDEIDDLRAVLRSFRYRMRTASSGGTPGTPPTPGVPGMAVGSVSGFVTPGTPAQLVSTEEVNDEATQLSTRRPLWAGPGGRDIEIVGEYDGPDDDTLTFTVTSANGRDIEVTDSSGAVVDDIRFSNDPADPQTKKTIDGLKVRLYGGTPLTMGDSFTLDVFVSQDGAIDPDDPFDGVGDANPRFESKTAITNGSFEVNGTTIAVSTSDSLNDVLARITAQVAGVVASYDPDTERVTIETTELGADQTLEIDNDTSGLIAALNLKEGKQDEGTDGPADAVMNDTEALKDVKDGTITVNGTEIDIDRRAQSLNDVLMLINDIEGVTASINADGRVEIAGPVDGQLVLEDDGTRFFQEIGVLEGTYDSVPGTPGTPGTPGKSGRQRRLSDIAARRITAELSQLREALDDVIDNEGLVGLAADMRTKLGVAVETALKDADGVEDLANFLSLDDFTDDRTFSRARTTREVQRAYRDVRSMMLGPGGADNGLLEQLEDIVREGLRGVANLDVKV